MALLEYKQHIETRKLWEEVFDEDSAAFLDYYYDHVADHNRIFALKEHGEWISMIHLNPYEVIVGGEKTESDYIVAVATKEAHRHQGKMRMLLNECFRDMYERQIPFSFLMPASEQIYLPFDYVTVYRQNTIKVSLDQDYPIETKWRAVPFDVAQMDWLISFSNQLLDKRTGSYTYRSREYYERIIKEQTSMNGMILLFQDGEEYKGYCFSGCEAGVEVWEIGVCEGDEQEAVQALNCFFETEPEIIVHGFFKESVPKAYAFTERPLTMIRIMHLSKMVQLLKSEKPVSISLSIRDQYLKENDGSFCICLTPEGGSLTRIKESEKLPEISIAELTAILFGMKKSALLPMEYIKAISPVFFNELV